ncbi:MAG: dTDP-4-dehydrorhamnose 3,5-epimerase family protein [Bauldia sp.]|nr:dTDP-4-dehydrorhamnose 3,5-epimerase family protein [Bauldia sp.]
MKDESSGQDGVEEGLLQATLAAARRDGQTSLPSGAPTRRLTHGVVIRDLPTFADERGSVTELYDLRWNFHPDPLVFAHTFTIRPGFVKGWGLHKKHEDRYAIFSGEMALVLFDPRPNSPTCGEVCRIILSEHRRQLVNVPRFVWHADHNIGTTDVLVVSFPTMAYDHADPDKYRLPLDTDLIPYSFGSALGG